MIKKISTALLFCSIVIVSTSNAMKNLNSINENLSDQNNNIIININNNQQYNNINFINDTINTNDNKIDSIDLQFGELEENTNRIVKDGKLLLNVITDSIADNTTKFNDQNQIITNNYIKFLKYNIINIYKSFKQIEFTDKNSKNNITKNFMDYIKDVQQVIRNNNDNGSKDYVLDIIYQYIVNKEYISNIIKTKNLNKPTSNTVKVNLNDAIKLQFVQLQYYYFLNVVALTSYYQHKNEDYDNWFVKEILNDELILKTIKYEKDKKQNTEVLSKVFSNLEAQLTILNELYNNIINVATLTDEELNKRCEINPKKQINDRSIKELYYLSKILNQVIEAISHEKCNFSIPQRNIIKNDNLIEKLDNNKQYFLGVLRDSKEHIESKLKDVNFVEIDYDKISRINKLKSGILKCDAQYNKMEKEQDKYYTKLLDMQDLKTKKII